MDILLKMKDLQRKIEQVAAYIPNSTVHRHINNLDCSINRHSSNSCNNLQEDNNSEVDAPAANTHNTSFIRTPYNKLVFQNFSKKLHYVNDCNLEQLQSKRVIQIKKDSSDFKRQSRAQFPSSNSLAPPEKSTHEPTPQLQDRITKIEENFESLQKKLDILINLSTDKT